LILILNHFKTGDFDFKSLFRCVILISNHFTCDLSQHWCHHCGLWSRLSQWWLLGVSLHSHWHEYQLWVNYTSFTCTSGALTVTHTSRHL